MTTLVLHNDVPRVESPHPPIAPLVNGLEQRRAQRVGDRLLGHIGGRLSLGSELCCDGLDRRPGLGDGLILERSLEAAHEFVDDLRVQALQPEHRDSAQDVSPSAPTRPVDLLRPVLEVEHSVAEHEHRLDELLRPILLEAGASEHSTEGEAGPFLFPGRSASYQGRGLPPAPSACAAWRCTRSTGWARWQSRRSVPRTSEGYSRPPPRPRSWAIDPGTAKALAVHREHFMPQAEASSRVFVGERGEALSKFGMAALLRQHLQAIGLKAERPEPFVTTDERHQMRVHDLRGTFVTLSLAEGRSESWIADRTGHRSSTMINRCERTVRSFAERNLGSAAPLVEAVPELARLAATSIPRPPEATQPKGERATGWAGDAKTPVIMRDPNGTRTRVTGVRGRCPNR